MSDWSTWFVGEGPPAPGEDGGAQAPGPADRSRRGPILVLEDEPDARDAIIELLQVEGYWAVGAANGAEALTLLQGGLTPAIMLVDLTMPVMDGWDFCASVGADPRWANIPIAIVTASANLEDLPERRQDAGLFVKPINVAKLLDVVRESCR